MKVGWMWFDKDPNKDTEQIVTEAIVIYRRKFGRKPNACYMNQGHPCQLQVGPVKVTHVRNILPHHFWLGEEAINA